MKPSLFYQRLCSALLCGVIFLLPSNLFLSFAKDSAYVRGLWVDYLLPKFYLNDLFIFGLLGLWVLYVWTKPKSVIAKHTKSTLQSFFKTSAQKRWGACFVTAVTLLGMRQFWSTAPLASMWFLFKLLEMFLFGIFLLVNKPIFNRKLLEATFIICVLFQSGVGLLQFIKQESIFPSYLFFGETRLSAPAGVEHAQLFGADQILPYGTTAHPNILGGVLAVMIILLVRGLKDEQKWYVIFKLASICLGLYTIFLTQSLSAWLVLFMGMLWWFAKKYHLAAQKNFQLQQFNKTTLPNILFSFLFVIFFSTPFILHILAQRFPDSPSLTRRASLNTAAWQMFVTQPLSGVGLNMFTIHVEEFAKGREVVRFLQPAHHVGLLWLAEAGVLGIGVIYAGAKLFILFLKSQIISQRIQGPGSQSCFFTLFILLPLLSLDHYLLTQQTGLLLTVITLFCFARHEA